MALQLETLTARGSATEQSLPTEVHGHEYLWRRHFKKEVADRKISNEKSARIKSLDVNDFSVQ